MSNSSPNRVSLVRHPASAPSAARGIEVEFAVTPGSGLRLRYLLHGPLERLRIPPPAPAARMDGLWRHTCFEAFVAGRNSPAYCEFNFSPSGDWAAYGFATYRNGSAPLSCGSPPVILVDRSAELLALATGIDCVLLETLPGQGTLRLALSAVLEEEDGRLSYWALTHPAEAPDFHHPDAFVLEVPRPGEAAGGGESP
jgi:hypothetical protein